MRINDIELFNFGPFYKTHRFDLGDGINLINGPNGSGKTFIFKAVKFGLYGESLVRLGPEVINKQHLKRGGREARVSLNIEFMGRNFRVVRTIRSTGALTTRIDDGGPKTLEEFYGYLPSDTATFYLLDGEEVRQWMMSIGESLTRTAAIFGLGYLSDVLDTFTDCIAAYDLQIEEFDKSIGGLVGRRRIDSINEEIQKNQGAILRIQEEIKRTKTGIEELERVKGLIRRYSRYREQDKRIKKELVELKEGIRAEVASSKARMQSAPFSLVRKDLLDALEFVELGKQEAIAARIKLGSLESQSGILERILSDELCICGQGLASSDFGKKEIGRLFEEFSQEIISNKIKADVELWSTSSMMDMRSKVDHADKAAKGLGANLNRILQLEAKLEEKTLDRVENEKILKQLKNKITSGLPHRSTKGPNEFSIRGSTKEILNLERNLGKLEGRADTLTSDILARRADIKELKRTISNGRAEQQKHRRQLMRERDGLVKTAKGLDGMLRSMIEERMLQFEKRTNSFFNGITNKPGDFISIELVRSLGTPFVITDDGGRFSMQDISDGERQIVMLCMISALKSFSPAEVLVVDAPFGRLDLLHIRSILRSLPKLAPQTLLFVTDREYAELFEGSQTKKIYRILHKKKQSRLELVK